MGKLRCVGFFAVLRQLAFVILVSVSLVGGGAGIVRADSAATGGGSEGAADGSNSGSTQTSSEATSSSYAESVGDNFAHGQTTSSSSSAVSQNDDGTTTFVNVGTHAKANATSQDGQLNATATADQNGSTGASSSSGGVSSTASSSQSGLFANAFSTNGSTATASSGKRQRPSAVTFVIGGTTTTAQKGRRAMSLSVDLDGNYSAAIAGRRNVRAVVGTTANLGSLTINNLGSLLRSAMYAEAMAGYGSVSARARAQIEATSNSAMRSAYAGGFSEAFASVKRRGNSLIVTIHTASNDPGCGDNRKRKLNRKSCVLVQKVVHLGRGKPMADAGSAPAFSHQSRKK